MEALFSKCLPIKIGFFTIFCFSSFCPSYYYFQFANGWTYGETFSESAKVQPLMKQYKLLSEKVRELFTLDPGLLKYH